MTDEKKAAKKAAKKKTPEQRLDRLEDLLVKAGVVDEGSLKK